MPWDNIKIEQKIELFETRSRVGKERQPEWTSHLEALGDVIKQTLLHDAEGQPIHTPYEKFNSQLFENLCRCRKDFAKGGNWLSADCEATSYLYRIETLSSFIRKHENLFSNFLDIPGALNIQPNSQSFEQIFDVIFNTYREKSDWLNLNIFVKSFHAIRDISWWSNDFKFERDSMLPQKREGIGISFQHKWIIDFAFQVGISSDWLADYLLFLRMKPAGSKTENIKVPSVIDAYTQPIFSPQTNNHPSHGKAFDLASDVKPKTKEFVVKDIPIESLSFIPVKINEKELDSINAQPRITETLISQLISNI